MKSKEESKDQIERKARIQLCLGAPGTRDTYPGSISQLWFCLQSRPFLTAYWYPLHGKKFHAKTLRALLSLTTHHWNLQRGTDSLLHARFLNSQGRNLIGPDSVSASSGLITCGHEGHNICSWKMAAFPGTPWRVKGGEFLKKNSVREEGTVLKQKECIGQTKPWVPTLHTPQMTGRATNWSERPDQEGLGGLTIHFRGGRTRSKDVCAFITIL